MGCDYYVWVETVIQYVDTDGFIKSVIEGTSPKRGWIYYGDTDFDKPYGLNDVIRDYGRRVMFESGSWYCLPAGKLRVQGICYSKKIPIDSVISVFKFKNGYCTF